ncbi:MULTISPECIES: YdiU family protein [unclassified Psychrosphaera]|uniref:protein adenylyltransferase SelO n=1 Tax=unclassified Psychrosphaera TaxID=2641570 RepID=UPI00209082CC|nr:MULTISPECIES: YdiU family protein [unclassified Psychrosphaera]
MFEIKLTTIMTILSGKQSTKITDLRFSNTYANSLSELGHFVNPTAFPKPKWVSISSQTSKILNIDATALESQSEWLNWFSGNQMVDAAQPIAQKYTGHQFGQYNPELGDGRGLLLGELLSDTGRWDIHVKGAGKTPYSRFGDGRAVLRSCIREYLASEALHHLGIPTSRALGLFTTGEKVQRETIEPGAALIRVCESHLRFGHFEYAFYQNDTKLLEQLVAYAVTDVLPQSSDEIRALKPNASAQQQAYQLLKFTIRTTAEMIAKWQAYGFCHGVMNTDNMSILGITFDYGPYGFLDVYEPSHICNHSDHSGRYAFDEQPSIGLWNLNALGYSLSPLLSKEELTELLKQYETILLDNYSSLMRKKLGFKEKQKEDQALLGGLLALMQEQKRDYTYTWRMLSNVRFSDKNEQVFIDTFVDRDAATAWLKRYKKRVSMEVISDDERCELMYSVNPKYIVRNYLAQQVIEAAESGDNKPLEELLLVLSQPFAEQPDFDLYSKLPPDWAGKLSISCSS